LEAEIRVWFTLTGLDLDPNEITTATNLEPSKAWRKGDLIDPRRPARRHKEGGWSIASGCEDTVDIESQIKALLKRLCPARQALVSLGKRYDAEVECVMYIYGGERPAEHFDRDAVRQMAELNASIDVDLYILPAR